MKYETIRSGKEIASNYDINFLKETEMSYSVMPTPDFWVGNFYKDIGKLYFDQHEIRSTGIYFAKDINIIGAGLIFKENTKICIYETNTNENAYKNESNCKANKQIIKYNKGRWK